MISLYDLLKASNGQLLGTATAQIFEDLCWEAAQASPGQLFVAMETEYGDTHGQIAQAIAGGVSGVLCSEVPTCDIDGVSVVLVDDTLNALLAWSHYVIGKQGIKVIAVAGSIGKSIAVDAIRRVLETHHSVHAVDAGMRGPLSIPQTLTSLRPHHRFAVLKLDIGTPGNIARMVAALQPEVGVVTHVGQSPAEHTLRHFSRFIDYLSPSGLAVLNFDDEHVRSLAGRARSRIDSMGMSTFGADVMAYNVSAGLRSLKFDLRLGSERYTDQEMDIIGAHHLYGVMAALAVGRNYDIPIAESLNVLREIRPLAGRMNPLRGSGGWLLVDDTHSTGAATTRMLLDWTRQIRSQVGRVVLVLGDYEPSVVQHDSMADLGEAIASAVDTLVALGSQAANAAWQARRCGLDADVIYTTYSHQDVLHTIHEHVMPNENDVVIVTGHDRNLRNLNCVPPMRAIVEALGEEETHSTPAAGSAPPDQGISNYLTMTDRSRLSWLELDYAVLAENVRQMKQLIGNKVALMAVVKADAYGHGAIACAHTALVNGASWLGVSSIYDALALREAGVTAPILAMNYMPLADARTAIVNNVTATVYDVALAKAYNRIAGQLNQRLHVHVKVDSGMGRLGVMGKEVIDLCRQIAGMDYLKIGGIYTHFSTADGEPAYVDEQLKLFREVIRKIQASLGLRIQPVHAANTAATLVSPEAHFDMVRVGLGLYGMYPSAVDLPDGFRPVMSWKTTVCQVKTLPANHPVGYGNTYVTSAPERVAVLPVGYGDGLRRTPHAWGEVLIHGKRAPVLGRISMEKTVVSVHHIPGVMVGDEVVLLGEQGSERITAEEIADTLQTINYEITSSILPRVERH